VLSRAPVSHAAGLPGAAGRGLSWPALKAPDPLTLDPDALVSEARAKAALDDFGSDESFREGLVVLCDSLEREARLHDMGRATQHARIVDSLVTRLSVQDFLTRHPEILEEQLGAPVVIVGLMRTGTTRLHRLLGSGPAFRVAKWWETRYPAPFPGSDWRRDDPRPAAGREEVRMTLEAVPVLASVHPWDAEGADEEIMLLEHTFQSWIPESGAHVPSYGAWVEARDMRGPYRYLKTLLQFIQWQQQQAGRGGRGRWILKSPVHMAYVDTLLEVFPGARILQTHRDPVETIPSSASMYRALRALNSETVDAPATAARVRDLFHGALMNCMRSRDALPDDVFLDVDYRAVGRAPMDEARRVYDWLDMPFTEAAENAMARWLRENAREKRPPHEYTLEEFGFTESGLAEEFAEYRRRYILHD
jgi:hypothetical protein